MALNIELAERVLEHVKAHPEQHNQDVWAEKTPCGTSACIAGWAVHFSGTPYEWVHDDLARPGEYRMVVPDPETGRKYETDFSGVWITAEDLLGLTEKQAITLFINCYEHEDTISYLELLIAEAKEAAK